MSTFRVVVFLLGLALMVIALVLAMVPPPPGRVTWDWLFGLGLLLAVGSHGFPEGLV